MTLVNDLSIYPLYMTLFHDLSLLPLVLEYEHFDNYDLTSFYLVTLISYIL